MTEATAVRWTPQMAGTRNQIMAALRANGGVIHDETGKVASRLRELTGIPDTQTNRQNLSRALELLTKEGTIVRDRNAKRTFKIRLVQPPTDEVATLVAQGDNLSILGAAASPSEIDQLVKDCQRVYEGLQDAAHNATRFMDNGLVVIDAIAVLRAAGITTHTKAAAIKYYLRRLGLAWAVEKAGELDTQRWWWFVGDAEKKPFRAENLRAMATSDTASYEARRMARTGTPRASRVIVRRIGDPVAAQGITDVCDEPAVTDDALEDSTTIEQQESIMAPTFEDDPFERLVEVAEELERKNEELIAANKELRSAAAAQQTAHADEVDALKGQVATLKGLVSVLTDQLARDEGTLARARGLIERYEG